MNDASEDMAIVLPDETHVPATPGAYRVVPPPDLNELDERRFLVEYDFPFLVVKEVATPKASRAEQREAIRQAENWRVQHPNIRGSIGGCLEGYQIDIPPSQSHRYQFIPDVSYIDERTWSRLSDEEKCKAYLPCVRVVLIELMSATDKMEYLQAKVTKYVNAGAREGVVVDTRRDRVWVFKRNQQPYFNALVPIEFDSWPGFTLDCLAMRDARTRDGLM
ncbi:hypothetical protein PF005_g31488 [Phytophthora fragariae]|uniref:Putative restriction endonuclease domain-containing protein n=1 Tax=Phytophthora fragariae TaxID=53985 RepID=A0A6A3PMB5_9STRA|nr:hypothetical protein PF003_g29385 [Phytophthora fragariae]KAE8886696.1 hypothetical protein PF003_g29384 [Phytophthora fragariae]KAE8918124.1 hypothetical protein PF009_g31559 [Phytophthora fragariae]KAE8958449.1 hypothetical protein PF011_g30763 [Phytophthora fragariae]KAE9058064.1 hypothetical protein PF010_g31136 [Phytophthora fragariae]